LLRHFSENPLFGKGQRFLVLAHWLRSSCLSRRASTSFSPKQNLVFSLVGPSIYEELYEFRETVDEVHRRLAYDLYRFWNHNDAALQRLFRAFWVAALALGFEVALLLISLVGTLG
jgi:hypothetical protein